MTETLWCQDWTSHDDVTGEGEQTFYHECGQIKGHDGPHKCMGHREEYEESWESCWQNWPNRAEAPRTVIDRRRM